MASYKTDGQYDKLYKTWPTCSECDCRLTSGIPGVWFHFLNNDRTKDARGCKCKNLNKSWIETSSGLQKYFTFTNIAEY